MDTTKTATQMATPSTQPPDSRSEGTARPSTMLMVAATMSMMSVWS